jgi:hypothetical protein
MSGAAEAPIPRPEGHSKCDRTRVRAVGLESPRCIPNRDCTARLSPVLGSGSPRRLRFLCSSICSCVYCWSMPPSPACGSRIGLSAIWRTSRRGRRGGQRTRICRIEIIATDAITSMNPFGRLRSSSDPPHFRRQKVTTPPRGCTTRFQSDVFDPPHFRRQKVTTPPRTPPIKSGTPPLIGGPKTDPPLLPPLKFKKFHFKVYVPRVVPFSVACQTGRISIGTRRIEAYRPGMDQHPDTWTAEGVKRGLIRFLPRARGSGAAVPQGRLAGRGRVPRLSCHQGAADRWARVRGAGGHRLGGILVSLPRTCSGSAGWRERAAHQGAADRWARVRGAGGHRLGGILE